MTVRVHMNKHTCLWVARRMDTLQWTWVAVSFAWPFLLGLLTLRAKLSWSVALVQQAVWIGHLVVNWRLKCCPLVLIKRRMIEAARGRQRAIAA